MLPLQNFHVRIFHERLVKSGGILTFSMRGTLLARDS
jgi:hypothetical protein